MYPSQLRRHPTQPPHQPRRTDALTVGVVEPAPIQGTTRALAEALIEAGEGAAVIDADRHALTYLPGRTGGGTAAPNQREGLGRHEGMVARGRVR